MALKNLPGIGLPFGVWLVFAGCGGAPAATGADGGADADNVQHFKVWANIEPPKNDADTSQGAPYLATSFMSSNSPSLFNSTSHAEMSYRLWTNRCFPARALGGDPYDDCSWTNAVDKGNVIDFPLNPATNPPVTYRTKDGAITFRSFRLSDQCTFAQAAWVMGVDQATITASYGAGLTMIFTPLTYSPPIDPTHFFNICVMPVQPVPALSVLTVDYEPQDSRSAAVALTTITTLANLAHSLGKTIILDTNGLNSNGFMQSGIDITNAFTISQLFDYTSVHLVGFKNYNGSGNIAQEWNDQIAVLKGASGTNAVDYTRLMLVFDLDGTVGNTQGMLASDAVIARQLMLTNGLTVLKVKTNHATETPVCPDDWDSKVHDLVLGTNESVTCP